MVERLKGTTRGAIVPPLEPGVEENVRDTLMKMDVARAKVDELKRLYRILEGINPPPMKKQELKKYLFNRLGIVPKKVARKNVGA